MNISLKIHCIPGCDFLKYSEKQKELIRFLARLLRESDVFISELRDDIVYKTTAENRYFRRRMVEKRILVPVRGKDGHPVRGNYIVNPVLKDILKMYKDENEGD